MPGLIARKKCDPTCFREHLGHVPCKLTNKWLEDSRIERCYQSRLTIPQGGEEGAPALPAESKLSFQSPSHPQATGLQGAVVCGGLPGHCTALGSKLGHSPKRRILEMTGDMGANMAPEERFQVIVTGGIYTYLVFHLAK